MATSQMHSKWFERAFNGTQALDLDGVGAATIKLGIYTDAAIDPDTQQTLTGLTAVGTATGWTGPVTLSGVTAALDGSNNWVFDASDPSVIAQDASGFSNGRSIVISEGTNNYILYSYIHDTTFGNTTGPLTITFSASGIIKVTI